MMNIIKTEIKNLYPTVFRKMVVDSNPFILLQLEKFPKEYTKEVMEKDIIDSENMFLNYNDHDCYCWFKNYFDNLDIVINFTSTYVNEWGKFAFGYRIEYVDNHKIKTEEKEWDNVTRDEIKFQAILMACKILLDKLS